MKKKTSSKKKTPTIRQCWPQTPQEALKRGGGMYGTKPFHEIGYSKRVEYVIDAIGEICGKPPSDFDKTFLLQPLQTAMDWIQEDDPHGAAMIFFELGRRVERHYAEAFDSIVKAGVKRTRNLKVQAPNGGKATAHYKDAEVTKAFTEYKRRNHGKNAWDASNALIRKGQPLSVYKTMTGPYNRVERIAKAQGFTLQEWFDAL